MVYLYELAHSRHKGVTGSVGYISLGAGVVLGILVVNAVISLVPNGERRRSIRERCGLLNVSSSNEWIHHSWAQTPHSQLLLTRQQLSTSAAMQHHLSLFAFRGAAVDVGVASTLPGGQCVAGGWCGAEVQHARVYRVLRKPRRA